MIDPNYQPSPRLQAILNKLQEVARKEESADSILYYLLRDFAQYVDPLVQEEHFPHGFHKSFRQYDVIPDPLTGVGVAIYDALRLATHFWNIVNEVLGAEDQLPEKKV